MQVLEENIDVGILTKKDALRRLFLREDKSLWYDLKDLQTKEKEAYDEAKALRKKFKTLVIKEGVAKPSSTNIFSTVSTPAKASEDDSEIPPLEDIYQNSTDGIFTTSSFDDEGDPNSAVQTRSKVNKSSGAHAFATNGCESAFLYGKIDDRRLPEPWITIIQNGRWYLFSQDEYVDEILKKFDFANVSVHPMTSHLVLSREFLVPYLKGKPKTGSLVDPRVSSFDWNPTQIVIMLWRQILIGNHKGGVNFFQETSFAWHARSRPIVATSTTAQDMFASCQWLWA
ncbi:hypothetical protein Tco_0134088 [Tanacetum coccineum]